MARWHLCVFILGVASVSSGCKQPAPAPSRPQAVTTRLPVAGLYHGSDTAPVTLVEFGSFSCSICRAFTVNVFSTIDSQYVHSGKVRYRYVDVSPNGLFAHGAALSECLARSKGLPAAKRFVFDSVLPAMDPERGLAVAARHGRASAQQMKRCAQQVMTGSTRAEERAAAEQLGVTGTPTFIIGQLNSDGRLVGWAYVGLEHPDSLNLLIDEAAKTIAHSRERGIGHALRIALSRGKSAH